MYFIVCDDLYHKFRIKQAPGKRIGRALYEILYLMYETPVSAIARR